MLNITSDPLADKMISMLDYNPSNTVFEPCAGTGAITSKLYKLVVNKEDCLSACEMNVRNRNELRSACPGIDIGVDIFEYEPENDGGFDRIIMVPPHKDGIDLTTIRHCWTLLNPGGIMVSLTHPDWMVGRYTIQRYFRKWLYDKKYDIVFVEDDSYANAPKAIIKLYKK